MVNIFDTTLRDGEQMPGVVFRKKQKIKLAEIIADIGIKIIDIMPSLSTAETEISEYLCERNLRNFLAATTMMRKEHIDLALKIGFQKIILFTSLSDIHLKNKLNISRRENLERSLKNVEYAKEKGLTVIFAGEDSSRANFGYLVEFINAHQNKIDYFFACDTLGILTPRQTYDFITSLKKETNCEIGLHVHNDFGQATANTLAGIEAGADLFSGTFTGIGERAGNAPIEEVVMALRFQYNQNLPFNYEKLGELCDLVEEYSGVGLQRHKPISGKNAFSHESGIHVDGILKYPKNYENFDPGVIGRKRRILFGKHSGTCSLRYLFGNRFSESQYSEMLQKIKSISESKKTAFSEKEVMEILEIEQ